MPEPEEEKMTPFDQMVAQDQLQMLKAAIPYTSQNVQPVLAIFCKWLELQRTIHLFSNPPDLSMMSLAETPRVSPFDILCDISRFTSAPQREHLEQMMQTLQTFQMLKNFEEVNEHADEFPESEEAQTDES